MGYIEFKDVSKSYGKNKILDGISLSLDEHKVLGVLGPSGSGKTTLLRLLSGLENPDTGTIKIDGKTVSEKTKIIVEPEHRHISMVFQDLALWPHMTVSQHLEFVLEAGGIKGTTAKEPIQENLKSVGLERYANSYPHQLSGGEKQRLALARALVQRPKVLLFDEPLSSLDQIFRKDLLKELLRLKAELGLTTIYVTHNYTDIIDLSDEIAILDKGRIIQRDKTRTVFQKPANDFVAELIGRK
jgi:ABC-type Fe3+/spermidine/putrescine transport system ATPase subunit